MRIPGETSFLFVCAEHNRTLEGTPSLEHPNPRATAVWTFDLTEMVCPGVPLTAEDTCQPNWEVRA